MRVSVKWNLEACAKVLQNHHGSLFADDRIVDALLVDVAIDVGLVVHALVEDIELLLHALDCVADGLVLVAVNGDSYVGHGQFSVGTIARNHCKVQLIVVKHNTLK